ncbi:MAG: diadenosine tetraphosphate (Ap4A) HIT family hydrolase [Paracoccaceae bacterium]|jgi:diadenosine tetraphosphate (Ap4A) HIT family hydrolase
MAFELHPRLEKGTHFIGTSSRCQILLKNNAAFPWLLIVPAVEEGIEDLHQLPADHFAEVAFLIRQVSQFVSDHFQPEKLNVACIGNIVRQMHIHIVGRSHDDPAWPGTVWASDAKKPYTDEEVIEICVKAKLTLGL